MEIQITGRNVTLNNDLKKYIGKRLAKLEKIYPRISRGDVILEEEKNRHNSEVILYLKRSKLVAKESSVDTYASLDQAFDTLKKQLRRMNGRLRSKRRKVVMVRIMKPFRWASEDDIME
jgi:ribosome hibernation promoting factor